MSFSGPISSVLRVFMVVYSLVGISGCTCESDSFGAGLCFRISICLLSQITLPICHDSAINHNNAARCKYTQVSLRHENPTNAASNAAANICRLVGLHHENPINIEVSCSTLSNWEFVELKMT